MAREALVNTDAPDGPVPEGSFARVSRMQTKLHRWAAADPGRAFDDLFNLVHDPATLKVAWQRVAGNTGARSAGVDGLRAGDIDEAGVQAVLGRSARAGEDGPVPSDAGPGTHDPQARRGREDAQARHPHRRRPGGAGGAEAGAGTDLRGRLRAGLLRVPAPAAGARRDRGDSSVRHPGLSVGAGR